MARFCVLDVQPDLFGAWCFIWEWGRIGRPCSVALRPYPTEDEAKEALARQRRAMDTAAPSAVFRKMGSLSETGGQRWCNYDGNDRT